MDHLVARELELGSEEGLNHTLIVLLLGVDGCMTLAIALRHQTYLSGA